MYNINAMLPRIATYLGNEWSVSTPSRWQLFLSTLLLVSREDRENF